MKVLVATREGQGRVPGDYSWTVDGELVDPVVFECCCGDSCGCTRGFGGLASAVATTTAKVVELPSMTYEGLRQALADSLERGGWFTGATDEDRAEMVDERIDVIEEICETFPVGAVIGRQSSRFFDRTNLWVLPTGEQ